MGTPVSPVRDQGINDLIKLAIELNEKDYESLKQLSDKAGIDVETACRLILEAFPSEKSGGKIIAGRNLDGNLIIAWPRFFQFIQRTKIEKEI